MRKFFVALAVFAAVVAAVPLDVDVEYTLPRMYPAPPLPSELDSQVLSLMGQHRAAQVSAAVVRDGRPLWHSAWGWQNVSAQTPMSPMSLLRIASISKQVSAIAVLQLVEQGKLRLDADVSAFLGFKLRNPFFPDVPITLRQLMTHTSSLNDFYVDFAVACYGPDGVHLRITELLLPGGKFYNETLLWSAKRKPGLATSYEYSNTNPMVVATAIEVASGERFDLYTHNHIFAPLEMEHTSFNVANFSETDAAGLAAEYAYFYAEEGKPGRYIANAQLDDSATWLARRANPLPYDQYKVGTNGGLFGPQGGVRTNIGDIGRLMLVSVLNGSYTASDGSTRRILSEESMALMHSVQLTVVYPNGYNYMYGFYQELTDELAPGTRLVGHTGGAYGFSGVMFSDPFKSKWGITLCSTGEDGQTLGKRPWSALLGSIFKILVSHFELQQM